LSTGAPPSVSTAAERTGPTALDFGPVYAAVNDLANFPVATLPQNKYQEAQSILGRRYETYEL